MDTVALVVKTREAMGSRKARANRRSGRVPAILYGHGMEPVALDIDKKALHQALHTKAGENVVISLKVEGAALKESTCLIKDIQWHPVTDEIQHVDFTVISLTEKIEVKVRLTVLHSDDAPGVKEGGILDIVHHEIPIECLPTKIPEKLELSVKAMKIGDAFHAKDLVLPEDVTCKLDSDEVVVALHPPKKEEVAVPTEEQATQPEVIEKGKKEEVEGEAPASTEKKTEKTEKKG